MADWQLKVPSGVIPKNLPVYVGLGFAAVLILVMFLTGSGRPPEDPAADEAAIVAAVADVRGVVAPVIREGERLREDLARLEAERESREEERRLDEERRREESTRDARRELEDARSALVETRRIQEEAERAGVPAAEVAGDIRASLETVEEREMREALRLDELQRFALSMRAPALVADPGPPLGARAPAPPPAPVITGDAALDQQLLALLREEAAVAGSGPPPPDRRAGPAVVAPAPPGRRGDPPAEGAGAVSLTERYAAGPDIDVTEQSGRGSAAVVRWADVPAGLDLVYEGRMMQAVLETQLVGDFTGEARARITVPVRTRDRTRVVIPRGTTAIGETQAVESGFQARLAVSFSRLLFPDGRSVRMRFEGLSSLGETGLTDEVNGHYLSTFGAVGAVGLLAGLSAGGGSGGYFDPARQQFSVAAIRFLDRFMNRLPEVRIRAGHPIRIYLTQDLLVPRA
ncbi:MAG: TrbI/VirB10 family protein [Acidobacteria bacterium]|nr:TrbI/VirB10 family protein [Acidobacteriota bacterium]